MIDLSHEEALLFRVLTSFFGKDHVIPHMSVMAVCGGSLTNNSNLIDMFITTNGSHNGSLAVDAAGRMSEWARVNKCLFTIVNPLNEPRMVIEFFSGFENSVSIRDVEHQRYLQPILSAAGVSYCTISSEEFSEITRPGSSLDFFSFLRAKCESLGMSV